MVSHSELIQFLSPLDWFVFFGVLVLTLLAIIYGQRLKSNLPEKEKLSALELLLMGRGLTLPIFVATLVATWYGGIFGVTALTFEKGIYNFLTQGVFWYGSYLLFAFFLVRRIRQYEVLTLAGLAGKLFGQKAEKLTAALNFLNLLPLAYTISLGLFMKSLFGGTLFMNTLIGVGVVTAWSLWGGFRAVVFSDVVQFFFMLLSVFLVVVFAWIEIGGPLEMFQQLPPSHLEWTGGEPLSVLFIWGFIALSTLVDPNFYQRCLAATSDKVAKKGIIISTMIWIGFDICTTLGALYARVALPGADPQNAYLMFSIQLVPHGIRGLILAGILATILSTLDAYLFNAATCLSYDLFNLKQRFRLKHHHGALILTAIISIIFSSYFDGNVVEVWKTLGSFSAACLLFPLMISQIWPGRISENKFCWAVSIGCLGIVTWRIFASNDLQTTIDPFYVGLILTSLPLLPSIIQWTVKRS